jgi:Sulfotransferase family
MDRPIPGRPPIIIVGAHRSGTTATTRALKLLGLQVGHRLDSHDEPREMQRLHEDYLRQVGAAWFNPGPFLALVRMAEGTQACTAYLRNHIDNSVFGYDKGLTGWRSKKRLHSGTPWGWKEPRTTLFAPCWLELFPEARFIHVVRHPLDVAASMQKRELEFQAKGDAPSGRVQDFDYCVDLAMIYVEAGEAIATRTPHYHRIRFEDIQADPAGQMTKMSGFCDLSVNEAKIRKAASTIRPPSSDPSKYSDEKRELLARYPLAAKLGYG